MSCKPRTLNKFISLFSVALGGVTSFGSICIYKGDETFYSKILMPFVSNYIDPELAHESCLFLTKHKLLRCQSNLTYEQSLRLKTKVFGMLFENPIGIAAGFDKNSVASPGLINYGLGFAEVGTVTPKPQDGNPKKRIFRLIESRGLINRCGFNNKGLEFVHDHLKTYDSFHPMILGLNIGKNKDTTDLSSDYVYGIEKASSLKSVDYIVINISSPNTPGLRSSQDKQNLERLLHDVLEKMNELKVRKPLLVKIAPDITKSQIKDIADVISSKRCGEKKVDGIILTNTTISRPDVLNEKHILSEAGGLSGAPLRDMSTEVIAEFFKLTRGQIPIIGVGGVFTGQDAYEKIKAGASLIQLYTSVTYEGPPVVNKIKLELAELLERDNCTNISDVVGISHKT